MKLQCYLTEGSEIDIQPAPRKRSWMDETPNAYAYRCLPLSIANVHGWEMRCLTTVEAEWNGGSQATDVQVFLSDSGKMKVGGHFGSGVLTFNPKAILRTPPGYNLWVTGPPNRFKDGIQPLAAVVETDWIPHSFTMNWKFTRPNTRVRFEKGEPFCFIFPVQRGLLEAMEPEILPLSEDPELQRQTEYANRWRTFGEMVQKMKGVYPEEARYQKWYLQGKAPDRSWSFEDHQKSLILRPFKRPGNGQDEGQNGLPSEE